MRLIMLLMLTAMVLVGCGNPHKLRYGPEKQPAFANLYADYYELERAIAFAIDTDGQRLEEVYVRKADGTVVQPMNIQFPAFGQTASIGPGVGVGAGSVGVGVGIGIPVGPKRALGLTTATFDKQLVGAPPWQVYVRVQERDAVTIRVGK